VSDDYAGMISSYYGRGDVATRILAALQEAGIDPAAATPLDLSRFDNLYAEIHRLLRSGGRYVLQEAGSGPGGAPHFPVPWTRNPAASFLQSAEQARTLLEATGFTRLVPEEVAIASGAQWPPVAQRHSHIFPGVPGVARHWSRSLGRSR
jgi:hypothetical protein